jgi:hypothetical protein
MTWTGDVFVVGMIALQIGATGAYLWEGDLKQAGMWFAYAIANGLYLSLTRY